MGKIEVQGGKPDLKKLAKAGRIKLTPTGDVEGQSINPVLYVEKKPIKVQGHVIGTHEYSVNGGHAHMPGSVWRVPLGGPTKYHQKVLKDEERKKLSGIIGFRPSAPTLDAGEAKEYLEYLELLKEKGVSISTDEEFYAWKK